MSTEARIKAAMAALRKRYPDAQSRSVDLRDDGILVLSVNDEVIAYEGPRAKCGRTDAHRTHNWYEHAHRSMVWCAGNINVVTAV